MDKLIDKLQEMERARNPHPKQVEQMNDPRSAPGGFDSLLQANLEAEVDSNSKRYEFVTGPAGSGKCLGRGTLVMLHSGILIPVERVETGMELMGPDSQPRRVLVTSRGTGELWKIIPVKGDPWVCNDVHVLTLVGTNHKEGQIIDVPLNEALGMRRGFIPDKNWKLFRVPVDFPEQPVPFHPYLAGAWLGDGTIGTPNLSLGEAKIPVAEKLGAIADENGIKVSFTWIERDNCYRLRLMGMSDVLNANLTDGNKSRVIPLCFLHNSRQVRSEFLAGILDTDGSITGSNGIDFVSKYRVVADGVAFLCRSLGFAAYITEKIVRLKQWSEARTYYRLSISGDLDSLPLVRLKPQKRSQVKDVLRTGWKAEPIGQGDYYGFTLSRDGRFLLGDFTVTHNTYSVRQRKNVILTATTGIAAVNLGEGTRTINSLLGFYDLRSLREAIDTKRIFRAFYKMDALYPRATEVVTDEASMLSGQMADCLFDVFDRSGGGGMKWTLVGDFAQLPPIGERGYPAKWAFESRRWPELSITKLTKIWRQDDPDYIAGLNCARLGDGSGFLQSVGSRLTFVDSLPSDNPGSVIMAQNESVDDYNDRKMKELPGNSLSFDNITWGKPLSEWKNIPTRVNLKVGAKVMTLANSREGGYVNGSIGTVSRLAPSFIQVRLLTDRIVTVAPIVDYNRCEEGAKWRVLSGDGRSVLAHGDAKLKRAERKDDEDFWYQGSITRWPIRLAWATTNHKSQGLTLDTATICLRNHKGEVETFFQAENMAYVALSRTRTLEGMVIVGTPAELVKAIRVSEKVKKAGLL